MPQIHGEAGAGTLRQVRELAKRDKSSGSSVVGKVLLVALAIIAFGAVAVAYGNDAQTQLTLALIAAFLVAAMAAFVKGASRDKRAADATREYEYVANGGNINNTSFTPEQKSWVLGGLGEMRTAKSLAHARSFTDVIHDVELLKNGRVSANIDHLGVGSRGVVLIDTKVWREPVTQVRGLISRDSAHWDAVSTCVYEASFLPVPPQAIVFVVSGAAGRALSDRPVRVTRYIDRYSGDVRRCPVPVFFVPQYRCNEHIDRIVDRVDAGEPVDARRILSARNLRLA